MSDEQLKDLAIKVWNATGFRTHVKPYDYNIEQIFKALKKVRDSVNSKASWYRY